MGINPAAGRLLGINDDDVSSARGALTTHQATMVQITDYLRQMAESSDRRPDVFEYQQSGIAPAGPADFVIPNPFLVPVGKRLAIHRLITTCTAGSGVFVLYVGPRVPDNIRWVIGTPQTAMDRDDRGLLVHGGQIITAVFLAANAGQVTCRMEGDMYPDEPDRAERY
jgi:hypothetical protein